MASVEFCKHCGASLPRGDITIKDGEQIPSPDYECPKCNHLAGNIQAPNIEPNEDKDIIVSDGDIRVE